MQEQIQWFCLKKQQLLKEIGEIDRNQSVAIAQLLKNNQELTIQIERVNKSQTEKSLQWKEKIEISFFKVKSLEEIINSQQSKIEFLEKHHIKLQSENQMLKSNQVSSEVELEQLRNKLKDLDKNCKRDHEIYLQGIEALKSQQQIELNSVYLKHQEQLLQRERISKQLYENDLTQMKKQNKVIVEKIESKYKQEAGACKDNEKAAEVEMIRLISQNKRLMLSINEIKMSMMNHQSSANNLHQQNKLLLKQHQMSKEQSKKEINFLNQEKQAYSQKYKQANQKIQELQWQIKEQTILQENQRTQIQQHLHKDLLQCQHAATSKIHALEQDLHRMSMQLQAKQTEIQEINRIHSNLLNQHSLINQEKLVIQRELENTLLTTKQQNSQNYAKYNENLKKQIIKKNCENQVLQEEIKRLKAKVNKIAAAHEQFLSTKAVMEKENKMLLSEIIFLRQKSKKAGVKNTSNILSQIRSEESVEIEDIETYKMIIKELDEGMNEALIKLKEKDALIEKQRGMIQKMERLLNQ